MVGSSSDAATSRATGRADAKEAPPRLQVTDPVYAENRTLFALECELRAREREAQELRSQLRAIHNSTAWAVLRTLSQLRFALAPRATRRDQLVLSSLRSLRRLKKSVGRLVAPGRGGPESSTLFEPGSMRREPAKTGRYAIVCLPIIEWSFRFQRPQQLMRQFARAGRTVFYAANRFHAGADARLRSIEANLEEMYLPGDASANVYQRLPGEADLNRMIIALSTLRADRTLDDVVVVVQQPCWAKLAELLRDLFGWAIVYDCMDDHAGFLHNASEVLEAEDRLISRADLVIASSEALLRKIERHARATLLVRNGCEYEHFSAAGDSASRHSETLRVGYYGAIADWFDTVLVSKLALHRPDWRFELIGSTLSADVRSLEDAPNIRLLGERPYIDLPRLIREWDVCIIPFKRVPLTEATNPVKVYEMLAAGKPIVAVGLPELILIAREGLIRLAETPEQFARAIEAASLEQDSRLSEGRRAFARQNTWRARYVALDAAIDRILTQAQSSRSVAQARGHSKSLI
jgi:glycosyltransferase involved in cell wall biosynthesis